MKKILFLFSALVILSQTVIAQEDPAKALKKASRDLGAYNLDPSNMERLQEAQKGVDFAAATEPTNQEAKTWNLRGEVYNAMAAKEVGMKFLDSAYVLSDNLMDVALAAAASFEKALELAVKKFETRDALTGLMEASSYLNAMANQYLQMQDYAKAYPALQKVLEMHKLSVKNDGDPIFKTDEDLDNHFYVTGFCAMIAEDNPMAIKLFSDLVDRDTEEPGVYSSLFSLLVEENEQKAMAVMEKGKAKFPGNTELLFAEINYYLKLGKLDELVEKLQLAIEKEPDNISLYTTLGNVYDNLFQRELEEGNNEAAGEYFASALKYYEQATDKDPNYFDAVYSIGALYYNKAAALTAELKELENDFSREGMKKFKEKETEVFKFFDQALPYFQNAEKINPNDQNTLIALREIYARKNELDMSKEFGVRLEKIAAGEPLESYFKNN